MITLYFMSTTSSRTLATAASTVDSTGDVAELLERDILSRQLKQGERYFSVRQIAEQLSVSTVTVHRAMKQLANRKVLEMRGRSGSFVGPAGSPSRQRVRIVHVIYPNEKTVLDRFVSEGIREGMLEVMPGLSFQLNILPDDHRIAYLHELCGGESRDARVIGAVLLRVPREVRQYFSTLRFPSVVIGHTEGDEHLPFVDRDQHALGQQAVDYLIGRGHKRVALLMQQQWQPGDNLLAAGAQEAVSTRNSGSQLTVQSIPIHDAALAEQAIRTSLDSATRPTALLCRQARTAMECIRVALQLGLRVPQDVAVLNLGPDVPALATATPAVTSMSYDGREIGRLVSKLMSEQISSAGRTRRHIELPTRLIERESA